MNPIHRTEFPLSHAWLVLLCKALLLGCLVLAVAPVANAEDEEEGEAVPSTYVAIEPPFVTNYGGPGRLRYMKVEVSLRIKGEGSEAAIERHMPYIRDTLLNLFAVQTDDTINNAQGKESLRQQAFTDVTGILEEEEQPGILEDILFTGFVVQR